MACVACMLVIAVTNEPRLSGSFAIIAYIVGTVGLGALSIGHDPPVAPLACSFDVTGATQRLPATKLGVLVVMLLGLWVVRRRRSY